MIFLHTTVNLPALNAATVPGTPTSVLDSIKTLTLSRRRREPQIFLLSAALFSAVNLKKLPPQPIQLRKAITAETDRQQRRSTDSTSQASGAAIGSIPGCSAPSTTENAATRF